MSFFGAAGAAEAEQEKGDRGSCSFSVEIPLFWICVTWDKT